MKYLGYIFDQSVSGESKALNVIDKVNVHLKFLASYKQKSFLTLALHRLLCNALIQPLFDYACTAYFSNLSKKIKITSSSITKQVHQVLLTVI